MTSGKSLKVSESQFGSLGKGEQVTSHGSSRVSQVSDEAADLKMPQSPRQMGVLILTVLSLNQRHKGCGNWSNPWWCHSFGKPFPALLLVYLSVHFAWEVRLEQKQGGEKNEGRRSPEWTGPSDHRFIAFFFLILFVF